MSQTIVAFAAHPDDLEFSCTGTLYKLKQQGYKIIYVIVTNGENGFKINPDLPNVDKIAIRKREQLKVAEKLGIEEVIFLGYSDGFLIYTEDLRARLVEIIKKYTPDLVFSFDPANRKFDSLNLFHRDHRTVAEAVFDACFAAKNMHMYPGPAHQVKKLYLFASHAPNHFEDITDLINFKLELLACHQSQFPDFSKVDQYIRNKVAKETNQYEYSEGFRILEVVQVT